MSDDKVIGAFIKKLREEKKLNQEKMANLVNIDRTVYNKWENGRVTIPATHLRTLAKIFDVSTDEILVGERMTPENREKFANIHLGLLEKNKKINKKVKLLIGVIIFIVILFLGYYFFSNFNSIHVYKITSESDLFTINNGLFIKARDKVYFELNNTYLIEEEKIDKVKVCYELNKEKKCILETSDLDKISFVDYYGYEEYVTFKNIKDIMANMYMEFDLKDGDSKSSKLIFTKDYANTNYFVHDKVEVDDNANRSYKDELLSLDDIYSDFADFVKESGNDTFNHVIGENNYKIYYDNKSIFVEYVEDNRRLVVSYCNNPKKVLQVDVYEKYEFIMTEFLYSLSEEKCLDGNCNNYERYFEKYYSVLSNIINNSNN